MDVHMLKHTSPYTQYAAFSSDLTTSWQTFTYDFTASGFSGTTTDTRFRFWPDPYDANGDQFFVDNVQLAPILVTTSAPISTLGPNPTSSPTAVTVRALMDAYVVSAYPGTNFNNSALWSQNSAKKISYIKFDLSSVTSVSRAVLRIRVTDQSANAHTVHETTDDWGESTITYGTRKTPGTLLATFTPNVTGWKEIDLTKYVNSKKGLSRVSIAIQTSNADYLTFVSSEGSYPPELVITP
jgi:hypothetical protein